MKTTVEHQQTLWPETLIPPRISSVEKYRSCGGDIEKNLCSVLGGDLAFKGCNTAYATHNIHAFAAKFPPQLPGIFIETLTREGEVVLDPMVGSGTALVEAVLRGRIAIGVDRDPLALMIAKMKTTPLDIHQARTIAVQLIRKARRRAQSKRDSNSYLTTHYSEKTREFFDYWFLDSTTRELVSLLEGIDAIPSYDLERLARVVFSSIIITKSGGVSLARDLAHSRPHRVGNKEIKNAIDVFDEKMSKVLLSLEGIQEAPGKAIVLEGDTCNLGLGDCSIDLVVTSPPYANAIDYIRAHKFSLTWFGFSVETLSRLRRDMIGAEVGEDNHELPSDIATQFIRRVGKKDKKKSRILSQYFRDMHKAIGEMFRVLRQRKAAIIVVGNSNVRGINVMTHRVLAELAEVVGFRVVGMKAREIDRDKRLMPWSHKKGCEGIEARIHKEYVIALLKP